MQDALQRNLPRAQQQHQLRHAPRLRISRRQQLVIASTHMQQESQQHPAAPFGFPTPAVAAALLVAALLGPGSFDLAAAAKAPGDAGTNVGSLSNKEVDQQRRKSGILRAYDGHVAVKNKFTNAWTDLKCDMRAPGLLLLREPNGKVYFLGYGGVMQVDLSDDQVVAAIAADDWENTLKPVQAVLEDGSTEVLELSREDFYQLVSLVVTEDGDNGNADTAAAAGAPAGATAPGSSVLPAKR
eukprot:GHRR01005633.1.p1 GENE.GHRR01005633.1~~GHRR01005633.1.p1  ORF type:complete len:241 (+),score=116.03 GHRR01005633.1:253-975(+)